MAHAHFTLGT